MALRGWFNHVRAGTPVVLKPPPTKYAKQARYRARLRAVGRCDRCGARRPCERHRLYVRRRYAMATVGAAIIAVQSALRRADPCVRDPELAEQVFVALVGVTELRWKTKLRWKTIAYALSLDQARARLLRDNLRQLAGEIDLRTAWDAEGALGIVGFILSYLVARGDVRYCGDDRWEALDALPPDAVR